MRKDDGKESWAIEKLVERAAAGDQDAIAALYKRYEKEMVAVVHKKLGRTLNSLMESVDLVQSVWKDVLGDLGEFEVRGVGSFGHWLNARVVNKIRGKGRYHAAQKRDAKKVGPFRTGDSMSTGVPPPPAQDPSPSRVAISREELENLERLLEQFPDPQRRALMLRLRDELDYGEIAAKIGKSTEATKKLYGRALKKLIALLIG